MSNNATTENGQTTETAADDKIVRRAEPTTMDWNTRKENIRDSKIMIVDDEESVVRITQRFLRKAGYSRFTTMTDPTDALSTMQAERPDVVLLDINMPGFSGLDILRDRQKIKSLQTTPIIILSANNDSETKQSALQLGAGDFLAKPVSESELTLRVQNSLIVKRHYDNLASRAVQLEAQVRKRTLQLEKSREQVLRTLARAAEYRDNETGAHVIRVGMYSEVIAEQLEMSADWCKQIGMAAQLHDVGKIAIPDAILLNPQKFTAEQFEIMKRHCEYGCQILKPAAEQELAMFKNSKAEIRNVANFANELDSPLLNMASTICRTHHEKWNGTGYPNNLKEDQIPIEGRITCVADVFDALCSDRPYKEAFPVKDSLEIMLSERGIRFDPRVLDAFLERIVDIDAIRTEIQG